jgi:acetyl-CoA acetyltransferase
MRDVAVAGVGLHPFGKFEGKPLIKMLSEVVDMALKDAQMEWKEIQGIAAGSSRFSGGMGWGLAGNEIAQMMGRSGIPIYNVSSACATGANAFNVAYTLVGSGACDVALAVAGEKMPKGFIPRTPGAADDASDVDYIRWKAIGIPNPGYWAMEVKRRMEDFGTTEMHLAKVSVKAHKVGADNPNARYRKVFNLEEVLNSPMVSYPLRLLEICAVSDGAAAAVLCSKEKIRQKTTKPVWVAASQVATMEFGDRQMRVPEVSTNVKPNVPFTSEVTLAVQRAFKQAGIGPKEINFIELQDNSVGQELFFPEAWGMAEPGECDRLVDKDQTYPNGKLPINPSGGFASFGEATTAMGVFQVAEGVWQLRGQTGPRQVPGAKVGLLQTLGLGGNGTAIILKS